MIEQLFGSKTRYRLLRLLFRDPQASFFVRELARALGVHINAIRRELKLLCDLQIVAEYDRGPEKKKTTGSSLRKYYRLNTQSLLYPELQSLLLKAHILDEQVFLTNIKKEAGTIVFLLMTGRFLGDHTAPSDLLIVGDVKERTLAKIIAHYEHDIGFEVRYTVMTKDEFFDRRQMMDKFLFALFEGKKMVVVNELGV